MTRSSKRDRLPLWARLETRVVAALALFGILSVGASSYLVQLTVSYFQGRLSGALSQGQEVVEAVTPFYQELVEAQVGEFEARAESMALRLALQRAHDDTRSAREQLEQLLRQEPGVLHLTLHRADGTKVTTERDLDEAGSDTFPTVQPLGAPEDAGQLEVTFAIDPGPGARYQALGRRKRALALQQSQTAELRRAVFQAVAIGGALVLLVSLLAGVLVARSMTRKVTELSRVMGEVARGNLDVRSTPGGQDELGRLSEAFNRMLDELSAAQRKLAYLQRIGAWQQMARRIAHEIKNPLTPIQLAIQQVRDKDPGVSPEFSRLLRDSTEIIEDEVAGLRRMVAAFSRFAKVPEVRLESVELGRLLTEFGRAYNHLTERADDRLRVHPPREPIVISADRQLLKQVLVNLVENSVLSAREVGVETVRVEVSAELDDGVAVIRVDDNGPGIPSEQRDRLFEPYVTTREHGSGLGLAIVKKIVLDHGGEVQITTSDLGGAAFVLRIPVEREKSETAQTTTDDRGTDWIGPV